MRSVFLFLGIFCIGASALYSNDDVVELTASNFKKQVLDSDSVWIVEFYAPWCGHCKSLVPEYKKAAKALKGIAKVGAVDMTQHQSVGSPYNVQGFPTIKVFGGDKNKPTDFNGARTADALVHSVIAALQETANSRLKGKKSESQPSPEDLPSPELKQAISQESFDEACKDKQLCIIAVLPHILDCQSKCRNTYIKTLQSLADKFKKNVWGWVWTEAGQQAAMEEAFGIGGFGYPAMVAVNSRKLKYSTMTGSFGKDGISEFLRDLSYGKGKTSSIRGTEFPKLETVEAWDGKDGVLPQTDDIDLSDVELDDLGKTEL
jgi:protein disulfide-isomerase A6